jgi:hypothetical protein
MLNAFNDLPGIALKPVPVEAFGRDPELDDEVAGEVLRLGLAATYRLAVSLHWAPRAPETGEERCKSRGWRAQE